MIVIIAKKWYNRRCGTTYHSVKIYGNEFILQSPIKYGYGDNYKVTAYDLINHEIYQKAYMFDYDDFIKHPGVHFEEVYTQSKKELLK